MTINIINQINDPLYYHRDYHNDFPKRETEFVWLQQAKRAALAALPFISLYKPVGRPLSLVLGLARTATCGWDIYHAATKRQYRLVVNQVFQTMVSVASLAGTFFAHPAGMLVSSCHDVLLEFVSFAIHLKHQDYQKATESCLNLINNSLYLALLAYGGLELSIASFALQLALSLYHSKQEFNQGHSLEACAHLLMSFLRAHQLYGQVNLLRLFMALEKSHPNADKEVFRLVKDLLYGHQSASIEGLKEFWRESNLEQREAFVRLFNDSRAPHFRVVRQELASEVYQPTKALSGDRVVWLSPDEIDERIGDVWKRTYGTQLPFYFHATGLSGLEGILTEHEIEVRREKAYRGAFVSTRPELHFGSYVFAFNRDIERKSFLLTSFHWLTSHWAGFSQGVQVNHETLSCIILASDHSPEQREQLEQNIRSWAGWDVPVVSMDEFKQCPSLYESINMGVPKEWPESKITT